MDHADVAGAASCGPATTEMLEREFREYKHRERRLNYTKTRPVHVAIGERRKPRLDGKLGYLRVDTVHQGSLPKLLKTLKREMNLKKLWSGPSCAQGRCATRAALRPDDASISFQPSIDTTRESRVRTNMYDAQWIDRVRQSRAEQ